MECPACGSRVVRRGYAPPRTYALILTGIAFLFATRVLKPALFQWDTVSLRHLFFAGLLLAAYGLFDAFRHGNRYCGVCGITFRAVGERKPNEFQQAFRGTFQRGRAPAAETPAAAAEEEPAINPHTPVEPILACLRFRDPNQRRTAARTLRKLTGEDFGEDAEAWDAWWAANKEAYKAARKTESP